MRNMRMGLLLVLLLAVGAAVWYFTLGPGYGGAKAEPWYTTFVWGRYRKQELSITQGPYKGQLLRIAIRNNLKDALAEYNFPEDYAKELPKAYLRAFQKTIQCPMLSGNSPKFAKKLKASLAKPRFKLSPAQQAQKWQETRAWLKKLRARTIESFLKGRTYFKYKFNKPDHPGQCAYSYRRSKVGKRLVSYIRFRERSFRSNSGLCSLRFLPSTIFHEMLHTSWSRKLAFPPLPQFSVMFRIKQWQKGNPKASRKAAQLALAKINGSLEEALVTQLEKACLPY